MRLILFILINHVVYTFIFIKCIRTVLDGIQKNYNITFTPEMDTILQNELLLIVIMGIVWGIILYQVVMRVPLYGTLAALKNYYIITHVNDKEVEPTVIFSNGNIHDWVDLKNRRIYTIPGLKGKWSTRITRILYIETSVVQTWENTQACPILGLRQPNFQDVPLILKNIPT